MKDYNLSAPCGVYCEDCHMLKEGCAGCLNIEGKPFWVKYYEADTCPIFSCCKKGEKLDHCGECLKFPCQTFTDLRDPSMSDEQFEASMKSRIQSLKLRKKLGCEKWLKQE